MKLDRVMIAAPKSGSGKTMTTCALLQALKDAGKQVVSCKCGPDFIDPMFHRKVIGVSSGNLDTFFTGEEETRRLFLKDKAEGDFAVLEGVMGLFDGLGGIREEGSSYHLAAVTKTPILLVADAKGMGCSVIPMLAGFLKYDTKQLIRGIILNRMSGAYYEILKPLIEAELSVPVLGYFPEDPQWHIDSRHLGLRMPDEIEDIRERLQLASVQLQKTVCVEQIVEIAGEAEELEAEAEMPGYKKDLCEKAEASGREKELYEKAEMPGRKKALYAELPERGKALYEEDTRPVIAVARDEAFCFYYKENLSLLEECGARIEYFSPLHDAGLPDHCSGLLIGGGYPELYAEALSRNTGMLSAIREALAKEMPVVAECGGFMYLHTWLADRAGKRYTMVGALPGICFDSGKLVRFGYVELQEKKTNFLPEGERIKAHEFHYFDSEDNGVDCLAVKPVTGGSYPCVITTENSFMGFPHLYYPSNPVFAEEFVEKVGRYRKKKEG